LTCHFGDVVEPPLCIQGKYMFTKYDYNYCSTLIYVPQGEGKREEWGRRGEGNL
jgi:hypothetical protein